MTTVDLYKKHKEGKISREGFLYEVRRDNRLPFITNLTSYSDAVKILKNKGIIKESFEEIQETGSLENHEIKDYVKSVIKNNPKGITIIDVMNDAPYVDASDFYKICMLLAKKGLLVFKNSRAKIDPESVEKIIHTPETLAKLHKGQMNEAKQPSDAKKTKDGKVVKKDVPETVENVSPYIVNLAIENELGTQYTSMANVDLVSYEKAHNKVMKNLAKNPKHYDGLISGNSKKVAKEDAKLKMQPVKKDTIKDKPNDMKPIKGFKDAKANTKASTKENKKGKPKGVKELTYHAKKAKGIKKVMPPTGKEKILEALTKVIKEHDNGGLSDYAEYEYGLNHEVKTPDGKGTIVKSKGGTLTIDLGNGHHKDYQINVIRHYNQQQRNQFNGPQESKKEEAKKPETHCDTCERKDKLLEKIKQFLKGIKKPSKLKKEDITIPTSNPNNPDSTAVTTAKTLSQKGLNTRFVQKKPGM
jgi:hypothetical protein